MAFFLNLAGSCRKSPVGTIGIIDHIAGDSLLS